MTHSPPAIRSAAIGVVLLGLASVAAILLLGSGAARSAQTENANAVSHFSVLQQPATQSDALPADASVSGSIVRRVDSAGAVAEWAAATGDQLCVVVNAAAGAAAGAPSACASVSEMESANQILIAGASSGKPGEGPQLLAGLVPNGISAVTVAYRDGTSATVPVEANGFQVATEGRAPASFSWKTSDGVSHTQAG